MAKIKLADRILSLVLEPNEASALVGDLLEERIDRGDFWFWQHVLQSLVAAAAKEIQREPLRLIGLGIQSIRVMTFSFLGMMAVFFAVVVASAHNLIAAGNARSVSTIALLLMVVVPALTAGIWTAIRAPGREFAAGVVANLTAAASFAVLLSVVGAVLFLLGSVLDFAHSSAGSFTAGLGLSFVVPMVVTNAFFFGTGAFSVRICRLIRRKPPQSGPPSLAS